MMKDGQRHSSQEDEDGSSYQKYESPKFFVGSGSPVRKQSLQGGANLNEALDCHDSRHGSNDGERKTELHGATSHHQSKSGSKKHSSHSQKKKAKANEVEQHFSF